MFCGLSNASFLQLASFPSSGHTTDFIKIREAALTTYPYRILYRLDTDRVRVLSVRHAARRWPVDIEKE